MTRTEQMPMAEPLLEIVAAHGEIGAQELLKNVARNCGDYIDFYPMAALLHAGYITTDTETTTGMKIAGGKLGATMQETALTLCRLALPAGESFLFNKVRQESWHNFPVKVFMTADGYLRLDELEQRRLERRRKRNDYTVSLAVAVLVVLLSSYLAHYFALKRSQIERSQSAMPLATPPSTPAPTTQTATPLPSR